MRKVMKWRRAYLHRNARRKNQLALRRKGRVSRRPDPAGKRIVVYQDGKRRRSRSTRCIPMPEVLCLDTNTEATLTFLSEMRSMVYKATQRALKMTSFRAKRTRQRKITNYFDFTTLKYIGPSAALIVASIYDSAKKASGKKLYTIDEHKWDPYIREQLHSLGFHQFLEMKPHSQMPYQPGDLRVQQFLHGDNQDTKSAADLQNALAGLLPPALGDSLRKAQPYNGIVEAISNAHFWAYPSDATWDFPVPHYWWMTGAVNVKTNLVTISIFDQGVSIPVSVASWPRFKMNKKAGETVVRRLRRKLRIDASNDNVLDERTNDGIAIRLAMGKSSKTGQPNRGLGMQTVKNVVDKYASFGRLRIVSRNGEYVFEKGGKPQYRSHDSALFGTLVELQLQF